MRRRVRASRGRLRRYVAHALASLPPRFREAADNVSVVVENRPTKRDVAGRRARSRAPLLGLYRGVPLVERAGYHLVAPDVIAVFRQPLLRASRTRRELYQEVRITVLHEFGHYLGLPESALEHL
jgi:predicted Zn-dependent protease with MMP-like domain